MRIIGNIDLAFSSEEFPIPGEIIDFFAGTLNKLDIGLHVLVLSDLLLDPFQQGCLIIIMSGSECEDELLICEYPIHKFGSIFRFVVRAP